MWSTKLLYKQNQQTRIAQFNLRESGCFRFFLITLVTDKPIDMIILLQQHQTINKLVRMDMVEYASQPLYEKRVK